MATLHSGNQRPGSNKLVWHYYAFKPPNYNRMYPCSRRACSGNVDLHKHYPSPARLSQPNHTNQMGWLNQLYGTQYKLCHYKSQLE
jgi:hypothetical protein